MVSTLNTRDGRVLTYEEYGNPKGKPVIYLHGMPGSRLGPIPRASRLYPHGIRLISYDRPGYGGSERHRDRAVVDAASDVEDLADFLRIERFAVVGRSGGGPHALACAALLPGRVTRVAALVSLGPRELMGEQWYEGMAELNIEWYKMAERGIDEYTKYVSEEMHRRRADPESVMPHTHSDAPSADRVTASEPGIRAMLVDNFTEALRNGIDGWVDDNLALVNPWGFDVSRVRVPVLLWHGAKDVFSPVAHSRRLAQLIPAARLELAEGGAHLSAIEELPRLFSWLAARPGALRG
jgi:pimeloyl-ACP methyl ester carboxylesterase